MQSRWRTIAPYVVARQAQSRAAPALVRHSALESASRCCWPSKSSLRKDFDQGRNAVLDRRNPVDDRHRLLLRVVLLGLLLADTLEEPDQRYPEQVRNLGQQSSGDRCALLVARVGFHRDGGPLRDVIDAVAELGAPALQPAADRAPNRRPQIGPGGGPSRLLFGLHHELLDHNKLPALFTRHLPSKPLQPTPDHIQGRLRLSGSLSPRRWPWRWRSRARPDHRGADVSCRPQRWLAPPLRRAPFHVGAQPTYWCPPRVAGSRGHGSASRSCRIRRTASRPSPTWRSR